MQAMRPSRADRADVRRGVEPTTAGSVEDVRRHAIPLEPNGHQALARRPEGALHLRLDPATWRCGHVPELVDDVGVKYLLRRYDLPAAEGLPARERDVVVSTCRCSWTAGGPSAWTAVRSSPSEPWPGVRLAGPRRHREGGGLRAVAERRGDPSGVLRVPRRGRPAHAGAVVGRRDLVRWTWCRPRSGPAGAYAGGGSPVHRAAGHGGLGGAPGAGGQAVAPPAATTRRRCS